MAAIDSVYNYYLTTYGKTSSSSRYDAHKKSELRDTYNRIVKSNKDAPLYKIQLNDETERFVIDLKERAKNAKNVAASLSMNGEGLEGLFHKKIAQSSDERSVGVEYIGEDDESERRGFSLGVKSLARPQLTTGTFLRSKGHDFEAGNFSFDLDTPNNSYEFQFELDGSETNTEVQDKIAKLINRSNIGINARVLEDGSGNTALELSSKQTGLSEGEDYLFRIQSGSSWNEVHRLGIDQVTSPATNAEFTLNGTEHTALSNEFTINNEFEVTLKAPTNGEAQIGFKANSEAVKDSVGQLTETYNSLVRAGQAFRECQKNPRFYNEITGVGRSMAGDLSSVGITADEDGFLSVDESKLEEKLQGDEAKDTFNTLNKFRNAVSREADRVSVNPMNYVNKLIVEYKNPGRTFSAPYATSAYAGMMVDRSL